MLKISVPFSSYPVFVNLVIKLLSCKYSMAKGINAAYHPLYKINIFLVKPVVYTDNYDVKMDLWKQLVFKLWPFEF